MLDRAAAARMRHEVEARAGRGAVRLSEGARHAPHGGPGKVVALARWWTAARTGRVRALP